MLAVSQHNGLDNPRAAVAVWAIAAETEEEALRLGTSGKMAFTLLRRGQLLPMPTVETAVAFLEREGIALDHQGRGRRTILGTPEQVRAAIEQVARDYGAEEAIVVSIVHDHAARMRSYELIAEAFGLPAGAPAPRFQRAGVGGGPAGGAGPRSSSAYIRVTVSLAPDLLSALVVVPLSVPLKLPHPLVPPTVTSTTTPLERRYSPIVEDSAALTVHVMPNVGSLTVHSAPLTVAPTPVMFGSVPENPLYLSCQGRLPLLIVPPPLAHLVMFAAVT